MISRLQASWKTLMAAGLAAAMLWSAAADSWAAPLDDAKAAGLIGERPDGFVAPVQPNPSPDIAAIVRQINAKRLAAYEKIAAEENVSIDQVGALAAEKIKRQAPSGEYFMSSDGTWAPK
jgi:uncharacterized protein YdbL (DUF1318 family)